MSRYFPQAEYAEDQPYSKTILTTHVLYRGFQTGAPFGAAVGAARSLVGQQSAAIAPTFQAQLGSIKPNAVMRSLGGAGTGSVVGTALMGIALIGRMRGREGIEWSDRSWRLLNNQGQLEVDDWSVVGAMAGVVGSILIKNAQTIASWKRVAGGAGLGSMAGVVGYMAWRYGVHGGKRGGL